MELSHGAQQGGTDSVGFFCSLPMNADLTGFTGHSPVIAVGLSPPTLPRTFSHYLRANFMSSHRITTTQWIVAGASATSGV